ncbi:UDP-glucuronosyltransferase 2B15-like [Saccoglossus kowalevskii]|uniref:UDP-glucuronosyltransferase n=1 Tax=Saccoglossus kowalevskii TaxID=10224 RepID=A0ABM0GPL6_SACKO|nr:PREDICTED: UDP-glucuronosyltransferase 2B15-like [Saccoglossus kowalevskii]
MTYIEMKSAIALISITVLTMCDIGIVSSARILLIPMYFRQHDVGYGKVADAIATNGHDVTMLIPSCDKTPSNSNSYKIKAVPVSLTPTDVEKRVLDLLQSTINEGFSIHMYQNLSKFLAGICDDIFSNLSDLTEFNRINAFDLSIVDSKNVCGLLYVEYFKLPFISYAFTTAEEKYWHAPQPLSYVPVTMSALTDKMTFMERLKNTVIYLVSSFFEDLYIAHYIQLQNKYDIVPDTKIVDIKSKASLWLWASDFAFEFPRPLMAHVIPIGSFTAEKVKPLPRELDDWIRGSGDHGIVVFSMGSQIRDLGRNLTVDIASALSRLPQRIVWRHDGETPKTVGSNTKIVKKWIPQNDLLANPNTRLFVTHGGTSGVHEGLYHGVPMLCIPICSDQHDNAAKIKSKGIGNYIDYKIITPEILHQMMTDIITDIRYKTKAQKLSDITRDKPMTAEESIVYWVNYVLKHGTDHLISQVPNLSWYQYFLLDVAAFVVVVALVMFYVIKKMGLFLFGWCYEKSKKQKTKTA